ncbi:MAG: aromatic amino acid lyase [Bacteroidota bacterium]
MSAILEDNQIHWDIDHTLTVEELVKLGTAPQVISLDPRSLARVDRAREILLSALDEGKWIYGMSSGFGPLAGQRVERADGSAHQAHLLYHLATGVGERLSARQSRTMCILRLFQLSRGYAGMSTATLQQLLDLYATGMTPMIPSLGSVGARGVRSHPSGSCRIGLKWEVQSKSS